MDPFSQALAAYRQGKLGQAEQLCRRVLQKDKKHVPALCLLADIREQAADYTESIALLNRAAKLEPRNHEVRTHLAQDYAAQGKYDQALAQVNQALKVRPADVDAQVTRAAILEHQGAYDRALVMLEPLMAAARPSAGLAAVYLRILTRENRADEAVEAGRRVLGAEHPPDRYLRDAWFALAKACERAGDYPGAMAAGQHANALLAAPFDREAQVARVSELIEVFCSKTLAAAPHPAAPSERPIFVVGMPRCGSTLLERILHAHPRVFGAGELTGLARVVSGLQLAIGSTEAYPRCALDMDQPDVERAAGQYLELLDATAPRGGAERIVDKQLGNFPYLGLMDILFPAARVIHCRRDPVDTCLSCYFERLQPSMAPYASDLGDLGSYYRQYERLMTHWRETVTLPLLEVSYEEVVADQEATSRKLVEFCGLEWDDRCLSFHEVKRSDNTLSYDQVRKPIYKDSVKRSDRFGDLLDPLRAALAGLES